jgi:hypothetical protein
MSGEFTFGERHEYWLEAYGFEAYFEDREEFEAVKNDPEEQIRVIEEVAGAPIALVREYHDSEGALRCAAITKSGSQCLGMALAGRSGNYTPEGLAFWVAARSSGACCFIHRDRTMNVETVPPAPSAEQALPPQPGLSAK